VDEALVAASGSLSKFKNLTKLKDVDLKEVINKLGL